MMAAGRCAERGRRTLLLERTPRPGNKIRIAGKGRCNITNADTVRNLIPCYGRNGRFLYRALTEFPPDKLIAFFQERGVPLKTERGGRVFPASDNAADIVAALQRYLRAHGVHVRCDARVAALRCEDVSVSGVTLTGGEQLHAPRVIIATGGMSYTGTGSSGDGYRFAAQTKHAVLPPRPALVPLETAEPFVRTLQGAALKNVAVSYLVDGIRHDGGFGEMLFTHYGVSGPVIVTISGDIGDRLAAGHTVHLSINFKPALDRATLNDRLLREFSAAGSAPVSAALKTVLPRALVPVFAEQLRIPPDRRCHQVTRGQRNALLGMLTDFRLRVTRTRPIDEAIVTRGGVSLDAVDPRTMESRIIRGLYFCGEVLDVDGVTGGYNLQAAFATGRLAGDSV